MVTNEILVHELFLGGRGLHEYVVSTKAKEMKENHKRND